MSIPFHYPEMPPVTTVEVIDSSLHEVGQPLTDIHNDASEQIEPSELTFFEATVIHNAVQYAARFASGPDRDVFEKMLPFTDQILEATSAAQTLAAYVAAIPFYEQNHFAPVSQTSPGVEALRDQNAPAVDPMADSVRQSFEQLQAGQPEISSRVLAVVAMERAKQAAGNSDFEPAYGADYEEMKENAVVLAGQYREALDFRTIQDRELSHVAGESLLRYASAPEFAFQYVDSAGNVVTSPKYKHAADEVAQVLQRHPELRIPEEEAFSRGGAVYPETVYPYAAERSISVLAADPHDAAAAKAA